MFAAHKGLKAWNAEADKKTYLILNIVLFTLLIFFVCVGLHFYLLMNVISITIVVIITVLAIAIVGYCMSNEKTSHEVWTEVDKVNKYSPTKESLESAGIYLKEAKKKINCPNCNLEYDLPTEWQGKKVKCNDCGHIFVAKTFDELNVFTLYKYIFTGCLSFVASVFTLFILIKGYSIFAQHPFFYAFAALWLGGTCNFVLAGICCILIGLKNCRINDYGKRMYLFLNSSLVLVFSLFCILNHITKSSEQLTTALLVTSEWIWVVYTSLSSITVLATAKFIMLNKQKEA